MNSENAQVCYTFPIFDIYRDSQDRKSPPPTAYNEVICILWHTITTYSIFILVNGMSNSYLNWAVSSFVQASIDYYIDRQLTYSYQKPYRFIRLVDTSATTHCSQDLLLLLRAGPQLNRKSLVVQEDRGLTHPLRSNEYNLRSYYFSSAQRPLK